jgi:hypothetical protein
MALAFVPDPNVDSSDSFVRTIEGSPSATIDPFIARQREK